MFNLKQTSIHCHWWWWLDTERNGVNILVRILTGSMMYRLSPQHDVIRKNTILNARKLMQIVSVQNMFTYGAITMYQNIMIP